MLTTPMTGPELAEIRRMLSESQPEFYARFGLSRITGSKYEVSAGPVPPLIAQAARRLESTVRMARAGLAFKGWIVAAPEDREMLEALGVRIGVYDPEMCVYRDCWLSPTTLERLGAYWGQFLWGLQPAPAPPSRGRLPVPSTRGSAPRRRAADPPHAAEAS